jgi:uncharacterized membrane protein HdeD (DUF308 family)
MSKAKRASLVTKLPFTQTNYQLFGLGIVVILLGYFALAQKPVDGFWSLTLAPILLVVGYCVIIPVAIFYQKKDKNSSTKKAGD